MIELNDETLNKIFTTDGRDAWRVVSFCKEPTAKIINLETKEERDGSIYSLNLGGFKEMAIKENVNV